MRTGVNAKDTSGRAMFAISSWNRVWPGSPVESGLLAEGGAGADSWPERTNLFAVLLLLLLDSAVSNSSRNSA